MFTIGAVEPLQKMINSLTIDQNEVENRIKRGDDYVIRFKTPENETLHLKDLIRGDIKNDTNILDDKVLFKSDGMIHITLEYCGRLPYENNSCY